MNSSVIFILFVNDKKISKEFYEKILESIPVLDVPGMTEFKLNENSNLGLMPKANIKRLLGEELFTSKEENNSPCSELYLLVEDVNKKLSLLSEANGTILSPPAKRSWGDTVAYGKDPDGNIIAFAKRD